MLAVSHSQLHDAGMRCLQDLHCQLYWLTRWNTNASNVRCLSGTVKTQEQKAFFFTRFPTRKPHQKPRKECFLKTPLSSASSTTPTPKQNASSPHSHASHARSKWQHTKTTIFLKLLQEECAWKKLQSPWTKPTIGTTWVLVLLAIGSRIRAWEEGMNLSLRHSGVAPVEFSAFQQVCLIKE